MATIGELTIDVKFVGMHHNRFKLRLLWLVAKILGVKVDINTIIKCHNH